MIYSVLLTSYSKELEWVKNIYENSFPIDERREYIELIKLVEHEPAFNLEALYEDDLFVGFISYWNFDVCRYVEHFAIDTSQRGNGVGSASLQAFVERDSKPVVLEVELPTDEVSRRRIAFYNRHGFVLHESYRYIQPPYASDRNPVELRLMTWGDYSGCSIEDIASTLHRRVYGVK